MHRRTSPWASGIYAAALFVALLIVLLFLRSYSDRAADAVLTLAAQPEDAALAPIAPQNDAILRARDRVFNAISTAQHAALSEIERQPHDEDARP